NEPLGDPANQAPSNAVPLVSRENVDGLQLSTEFGVARPLWPPYREPNNLPRVVFGHADEFRSIFLAEGGLPCSPALLVGRACQVFVRHDAPKGGLPGIVMHSGNGGGVSR